MLLALWILGCLSAPGPTPRGATGATGDTVDTGEPPPLTGDTAPPVEPSLDLGAPERWSLDDESEPQHHAAVAWTRDGHLGIVWTLAEVFAQPTSWLRVLAPDGGLLADPIQVGVGHQAAKPDIDDMPDGGLLVGVEIDGVGIGLETIELPSLARQRTLIAHAIATVGNNSTDLGVRGDGAAVVTWYAGDAGLPASFFSGGLEADGAIAPVEPFASTTHLWPSPPDVALRPDGGFVIGWSDPGVDPKLGPVVDVELSTFGPGRALERTFTLAHLAGPLHTPPRPSVAVNGAGQLAVGYNTETAPDAPESLLAFLDDDLTVVRPATSLGSDSDRISVAFLGDDTLCVVWEGPGQQDPHDPSIWMSVVGFPDGAERVAPQRISDPWVNALRPNLDVRDAGGGRHEIAFVWEQLNASGVRTVWGRRATWGPGS